MKESYKSLKKMIGGLTGAKMIEVHSTAKKAIEAVKMPYQSIGIRIKVQRAGCNGHTYAMEWCYMKQHGDHIIEAPKRIYIDPKSAIFLFGSELQYKKEQFSEGFEFVNPNETSKCGCGESFYVA